MQLNLNNQKRAFALSMVPALLAMSSASHAALPVYITDAFTEMQTNATDLAAQAWPVLIFVFGGFILMKMFKKFISRATS